MIDLVDKLHNTGYVLASFPIEVAPADAEYTTQSQCRH